MTSITNLVPIRVDASSSDGAVHIIDTLLIDTTCLPISHGAHTYDGNPSGLGSLASSSSHGVIDDNFSLSSLIDANASHLTQSILADAEVYGTVRSKGSYMGGRLDLLSDTQLYQTIEKQINTQLGIALGVDKTDLISIGGSIPVMEKSSTVDAQTLSLSSTEKTEAVVNNTEQKSRIVRIKLRLRHENFVVFDEFDYDVNTSGVEGCEPFSIANALVKDLKLPPELGPSISASIVEQIYGVDVSESLNGFTSDVVRQTPAAMKLDSAREGTSTDFAQIMLLPAT